MKAVLVINTLGNSDRIMAFANFWLSNQPGAALFLASGDGTNWCNLTSYGSQGVPLSKKDRPVQVDCLFVHGNDFDSIKEVNAQLSAGWTAGFIFNSPGDPPCKDGFIRILRSTAPFALTPKHREEIVDFIKQKSGGVGQPTPLPSCCQESAKHLVALDILAQGYLFTHRLLETGDISKTSDEKLWNRRREQTEDMDWWHRGLKVRSMAMLQTELVKDEVAEANAENVVKLVEAALKPPLPSGKNTPHPLKKLREEITGLLQ